MSSDTSDTPVFNERLTSLSWEKSNSGISELIANPAA